MFLSTSFHLSLYTWTHHPSHPSTHTYIHTFLSASQPSPQAHPFTLLFDRPPYPCQFGLPLCVPSLVCLQRPLSLFSFISHFHFYPFFGLETVIKTIKGGRVHAKKVFHTCVVLGKKVMAFSKFHISFVWTEVHVSVYFLCIITFS